MIEPVDAVRFYPGNDGPESWDEDGQEVLCMWARDGAMAQLYDELIVNQHLLPGGKEEFDDRMADLQYWGVLLDQQARLDSARGGRGFLEPGAFKDFQQTGGTRQLQGGNRATQGQRRTQ